MSEPTWMPRAGQEVAAGCIWLPRLIDKGRRRLESDTAGRDLLWPYMFGDNDYADALLLSFLRLNDEQVLDVLRHEPDDAAAALEIVRWSGRTQDECESWSRRFRRTQAFVFAMIDADEGRLPQDALSTKLILGVYKGVLAVAGRIYQAAEARRLRPAR